MIQLSDDDAKKYKEGISEGRSYSPELIEALEYYDRMKSLGADNKNTFIPPTESDQTDYATIMKTVGQPAPKNQAEVEAFKGRLAKDVYGKDLSLVDIARTAGFKVPKYEEGPKQGQYKFSETVKTPEFQKFLKDMQESQRVSDMRKMVDKETRFRDYTDPETGEQVHISFPEGVQNKIMDLMFPTTLSRLSKGDQNITYADVDKEKGVNLLEALPLGSALRAPFAAAKFGLKAAKYGSGPVAKAIAGLIDIGAAPVAREGYNIAKGEKGWTDARNDALTGTLFNYAVPHVLDVGAGSIKEYVPVAKKAIESYLDKRNMGKNIDELLKGPSKAKKPDIDFNSIASVSEEGIPEIGRVKSELERTGQFSKERQDALASNIKRNRDQRAYQIPISDREMRDRLSDKDYLEWIQSQKENPVLSDYLNYMKEVTSKEGEVPVKSPYVQTVLSNKAPYKSSMIFDKNGNLYPNIQKEIEEQGVSNPLEYAPVKMALDEPKTWFGKRIDNITRSGGNGQEIVGDIAKGAGRLGMNKYSESEGGKAIGKSMPWGADEKTEEAPTETEEQKKSRQKKGKFYNTEKSKEIDEYKKTKEYRWENGYATTEERKSPEYKEWEANKIRSLKD